MSSTLSDVAWRAMIEARVDRSAGPDACWPWPGWRHRQGYGLVERGGRKYFVHRLMLGWSLGRDLPREDQALHDCDNPPCCNPAHLHVGTPADNHRESAERRRRADFRGTRSGLAKLTDDQVREIRARLAAGEKQQPLAEEFGVGQTTISNIKLRRHYAV